MDRIIRIEVRGHIFTIQENGNVVNCPQGEFLIEPTLACESRWQDLIEEEFKHRFGTPYAERTV